MIQNKKYLLTNAKTRNVKKEWIILPPFIAVYHGQYEGDYSCDYCGKSHYSKGHWQSCHFFHNEKGQECYRIGSGCIKRIIITEG